MSLMGQLVPRSLNGTFTLGSNCRGAGSYRDPSDPSGKRRIGFVFTVVNDGDQLFLQGSDPGAAIFGVAQRVQSDDAEREHR